jgi:predicted nuclease of restriction endonuclease-like (RecB) superfamily
MKSEGAKSLKPIKSEMVNVKKADQLETVKGYREILRDIQEILLKTRGRAYQAVDKLKVEGYWEVGQRIAKGEFENKDRADYGKSVVMRLSEDTGIDKSTLYDAHHFFKSYPNFRTVCGKLSWSIWRRLIRIANVKEREFYRLKAVEEDWSYRQFRDALKKKQFQKKTRKRSIEVVSPPTFESPQEVFREIYDFDFLKLPVPFKEYDLENAMMEKAIRVLTELGSHFCLAGRQVRILIDGNWDRIDLVFYHSKLHAFILADLKRGPFKSEYIGQMNKYIEYYRHNEETKKDNPTVGLILCEDVGYEEAVYALGGLERKIFVAQYRVKLPSEKQIAEKLRTIKAF